MIICPTCHHENPQDARRCAKCGARLLFRTCPSCGALNSVGNRFCRHCFGDLAEEADEAKALAVEESKEAPEAPPASAAETEVFFFEEPLAEGAPVEAESPPQEGVSPTPAEEAKFPEAIMAPIQPHVPPEAATPAFEEETEPALPSEPPQDALAALAADPLEGLRDVIPLETAVSLPHRATPHDAGGASEEERQDAEIFWQVAGAPAPLREGAQTVVAPEPRGLSRPLRLGLSLFVLLAALLTVLLPLRQTSPDDAQGPTRPAVVALAETLESLPQGATVLLSFDYGPAYAGEIDPLATQVVRHLAMRSVRMIVMSLQPAGTGIAMRIYERVAREVPTLQYGKDYAILGYLPEQEVGLRALHGALGDAFKVDHVQRRSLSELPVTKGLATLQDVAQVIVLADDAPSVRRWLEQVESRRAIVLHALVSARVEPLLVPYRESGQLASLLAAAYAAPEYASWWASTHTEAPQGGELPRAPGSATPIALFLVVLAVVLATNSVYVSQGARAEQDR